MRRQLESRLGTLILVAVLAAGCGGEEPLTIEGVGPSNGPPFSLGGGDYLVSTTYRSCGHNNSPALYSTTNEYFGPIEDRYFYGLPKGAFYIYTRVRAECEWSVTFEPVR